MVMDRWLDGSTIQELAPRLYDRVPRRARMSRTVHEAVVNGAWAEDVGPDLDALLLQDFFSLWMMVAEVDLQEGTSDAVR